jgi:hypothetical protein
MLGRVIFTWCILAAIGSLVTGTLPPHIGMIANRTIPPECRSLHSLRKGKSLLSAPGSERGQCLPGQAIFRR